MRITPSTTSLEDDLQLSTTRENISSTTAPQNGPVGLLLQARTDAELIMLGRAHAKAMNGNPLFPHPQPSIEDYDTSLNEFAHTVSELQALRLIVQGLTLKKDQQRKAFERNFTRRGRYVELASNGKPTAIAAAGLPTRRRASKSVGQLSWPHDLQLKLDPLASALIVTWDRVRGARSYVLEFAPVIEGQPLDWRIAKVGSKTKVRLTKLTPGQTYAFRLATIGGSTGQSDWSPPVQRMVA